MLAPAQNDARYLGMLEANALQDVVQLDVNAEVVGVQLELVAGPQAAIFVDVHGECGHAAVNCEPPMAMLSRSHVERDQFLLIYGWHTGRTLLKAAPDVARSSPHWIHQL
jgi:hypothetical protein